MKSMYLGSSLVFIRLPQKCLVLYMPLNDNETVMRHMPGLTSVYSLPFSSIHACVGLFEPLHSVGKGFAVNHKGTRGSGGGGNVGDGGLKNKAKIDKVG